MLGLSRPDTLNSSGAIKLIAVFALLRLMIAYYFPATIDEAYAIVVSRNFSLSYFDHPPIAFTIAQLMALLTGSEHIWLVRLPFILMGSISAWLVYDITKTIYSSKAAYWALCWFLVAPYFFISAGHFVVPDGPLNLALLLAFYCLMRVTETDTQTQNAKAWMGFGIFLAIALATKYQAVLFGISVLCWLLSSSQGRAMLKTSPPWIAAGIAFLGLLPALIWNANHDFVSFQFQSGRATNANQLGILNFLTVLLGQMAYILPGTWFVALIMTKRNLFGQTSAIERALAWIAILPITIFLLLSLFSSSSLPHWAMAGFLFTYPFIGKWCADNSDRFRRTLPVSLNLSAVGIPLLAFVVALQAQYNLIKTADLGWPLSPWTALQGNTEFLNGETSIYTSSWKTGAKIGYALGPTVTINPAFDPRHFQYNVSDKTARIIIDRFSAEDPEKGLQDWLNRLERIGLKIQGEPTVIFEQSDDRRLFSIVRAQVQPIDQ